MDAIHIPQLTIAPEHTERVEVQEFLPDLDTLTPVQGQVQVTHQGNYLEVSAQAEAIITLTCDRCLQQYNHRLKTDATELIWLDADANQPHSGPLEVEVPVEELVESLSPDGYFSPQDWLYQQLCLALPPRQLCDQRCPGITTTEEAAGKVDHRWAALEALKNQLPQS
jgi:uncharacterized protein